MKWASQALLFIIPTILKVASRTLLEVTLGYLHMSVLGGHVHNLPS